MEIQYTFNQFIDVRFFYASSTYSYTYVYVTSAVKLNNVDFTHNFILQLCFIDTNEWKNRLSVVSALKSCIK